MIPSNSVANVSSGALHRTGLVLNRYGTITFVPVTVKLQLHKMLLIKSYNCRPSL